MANATVEQLKALGIRHGEKAAVGIAGTLCVVFLGMALTAKPPVDIRPEDITSAASAAEQNINKPVAPDVVEERILEEGIKDVDLTAEVKDQKQLRADQFTLAQGWTSQEPGAGLIRETPELLAPFNLLARANRGGLLVYELDENGNQIPDIPKPDEPKPVRRSRRNRNQMGGMSAGGMSGGGMAGAPGGNTKGNARDEAAQKAREELKKKQLEASLSGSGSLKKADEKKAESLDEGYPSKEKTEGYRSVVVTALLNHKGIRESYAKALKMDISQAHPKYLRVALERKQMRVDGTWTDWAPVEHELNDLVLDNIPEREDELAANESILPALVSHLPFLKAGFWEGAHRREFVAEEKQTIQTKNQSAGGYGGMGMGGLEGGEGMSGMGGMSGMMKPGGGMGMAPGGMPGEGGMSGMSGMGMMMGGRGMGMMGGGSASDPIDYPTSQSSELMVRTIDFTVEPDVTYQYRMRLVVQNPNWKKESVAVGVDTKNKEMIGPPSDPSPEVTVPADLTAYVMKKVDAVVGGPDPRGDKVEFRLAKWLPEDGQIVIKPLSYGPGQIIGEPRESVALPTDGEGIKSDRKDLTSHLLVIDTDGGRKSVANLGITGGDHEIPAQALIFRPDGSMVLRNQSRDLADTEMQDVYRAYRIAIDVDSKKKREPGAGGYAGMSGGGDMPGGGGMMGAPGFGGGRR